MVGRWIKYGIGLDLAKDSIHACFSGTTRQGEFKVIAQRRFANTPKGCAAVRAWIDKHRKDETLPYQIVLEVTGVYHEEVLYHLHEKGHPVCLELAKRVKRYLQSIGQKSKNDKLDGRGLAQLANERLLRRWEPVSVNIHAIRSQLRHRKALIVTCGQLRNQLHAIQHGHAPQKDIVRSLKQLIKQYDKHVEQAEHQAEQLAKEDEALYAQLMRIVDSVKGLGLISVLTVVAETNGFKNFHSVKQLVSYAGYDVVENSSGKFTGKTRISKQGNARIRAALYMPALAVIRCKLDPFYSLYKRLLQRNGAIKKKANVAVQRKLLVLIYTLWRKNERFDEHYHTRINTEEPMPDAGKLVVPM